MEIPNYISLERLQSDLDCRGVTLLLRHAARHPIRGSAEVLTANLTEEGREQATDFGMALSQQCRIRRVFASPIARCVSTAEQIVTGAGLALPVQRKWWLFSPWLEVDGQTGGRQVPAQAEEGKESEKNGGSPVMATSTPVVAFRDPNWPALYDHRKLEMALARMKYPTEAEGVYLYITHDLTVLPLLAYLSGWKDIHFEQTPGYLEGIALRRRNGQVEVVG